MDTKTMTLGEFRKWTADNDTLHFESDYGYYTSGEYLIKFIFANPTHIIEHIFG